MTITTFVFKAYTCTANGGSARTPNMAVLINGSEKATMANTTYSSSADTTFTVNLNVDKGDTIELRSKGYDANKQTQTHFVSGTMNYISRTAAISIDLDNSDVAVGDRVNAKDINNLLDKYRKIAADPMLGTSSYLNASTHRLMSGSFLGTIPADVTKRVSTTSWSSQGASITAINSNIDAVRCRNIATCTLSCTQIASTFHNEHGTNNFVAAHGTNNFVAAHGTQTTTPAYGCSDYHDAYGCNHCDEYGCNDTHAAYGCNHCDEYGCNDYHPAESYYCEPGCEFALTTCRGYRYGGKYCSAFSCNVYCYAYGPATRPAYGCSDYHNNYCGNYHPAYGCSDYHNNYCGNYHAAYGCSDYHPPVVVDSYVPASGCTDYHPATGCTDYHAFYTSNDSMTVANCSNTSTIDLLCKNITWVK